MACPAFLNPVVERFWGGGYQDAQARSIPWDCTDWQAFAHDDRTTAILESLAENRGKTLYCGIDQSDTFTKTETWEAGKDRNERDDTVYFGERGQFRGFIAAQEGWLTDGESGVTGVSIDRIFEFPREERRRTKRVKRWDISSGPAATDTCPDVANPGTLACSDWGPGNFGNIHGGSGIGGAKRDAQARYDGRSASDLTWQRTVQTEPPTGDSWQERAAAVAKSVCRAQHGGQTVSNVVFAASHSRDQTPITNADRGPGLGWFFQNHPSAGSNHRYEARESRTWTATCKKTIRRTRK